jgi:hypothetical protein
MAVISPSSGDSCPPVSRLLARLIKLTMWVRILFPSRSVSNRLIYTTARPCPCAPRYHSPLPLHCSVKMSHPTPNNATGPPLSHGARRAFIAPRSTTSVALHPQLSRPDLLVLRNVPQTPTCTGMPSPSELSSPSISTFDTPLMSSRSISHASTPVLQTHELDDPFVSE